MVVFEQIKTKLKNAKSITAVKLFRNRKSQERWAVLNVLRNVDVDVTKQRDQLCVYISLRPKGNYLYLYAA